MAKSRLEKDKERFAEWRSEKRGGERIPDKLWKVATGNIPTLGLNGVSREFHLDFVRLRNKAEQFGVATPKRKRTKVGEEPEVRFQELPMSEMLGVPQPVPCVVLERPDGLRVRIEGLLPEVDYVGKLAACLWK